MTEEKEKKTLVSCPAELLEQIAENVYTVCTTGPLKKLIGKDLLALRLVSKDLAAASDRVFLREYFTKRNHLLTVDSLKALVNITSTPRMCKKVETLTLSMPWLERVFVPGHDDIRTYCDTKSSDRAAKREEIWTAWEEQSECLIQNYQGRQLLDRAFRNMKSAEGMPGCLDLSLAAEWEEGRSGSVHGRASLQRHIGVRIIGTPRGTADESLIEVGHAISIVLDAVGHVGLLLCGLHLPERTWHESTSRVLDRHDQPRHLISQSLSTVTAFSLAGHSYGGDGLPSTWKARLEQHASIWLPNLISLTVTAESSFKWLARAFGSQQLRKIQIREDCKHGRIRSDDIIKFLAQHQTSLEHLQISDWGNYDSWKYLQQDPLLQAVSWAAENMALLKLQLQGWRKTFRFNFTWTECLKLELAELKNRFAAAEDESDEEDWDEWHAGFEHDFEYDSSDELDDVIKRDHQIEYNGYHECNNEEVKVGDGDGDAAGGEDIASGNEEDRLDTLASLTAEQADRTAHILNFDGYETEGEDWDSINPHEDDEGEEDWRDDEQEAHVHRDGQDMASGDEEDGSNELDGLDALNSLSGLSLRQSLQAAEWKDFAARGDPNGKDYSLI